MSIVCAISGEIPDVPIVSHASGHVFEKRLLEKWIEDKGTDPVTEAPLSMEQTTEIKNADTIVRPRAPAWTSVPGILKALQDEWDALMLHQFGLREQLQNSRQELSHTLYQHDASCRVIARLQRETAEAKEALAELRPIVDAVQRGQVQAVVNGDQQISKQQEQLRAEHARNIQAQPAPDQVVVDGQDEDDGDVTNRPLPQNVIDNILKTNEDLTKQRKKRHKDRNAFPDLAKQDEVMNFSMSWEYSGFHSSSHPGIFDFNFNNELLPNHVLTAGQDKTAILFDMENEAIVSTLGGKQGHNKKLTNALIHPIEAMGVTASVDQTVKLWALKNQEEEQAVCLETMKLHSGTVSGISLHPVSNYILTAGYDGAWNFVDLPSSTTMTSVKTDFEFTSCQVHPDGRIFATGTQGAKNSVLVWDISERQQVHEFEGHTDGVTSISFSDNGYFMASSSKDGSVRIWDLRKLKCRETIPLVEGAAVNSVQFDGSGTYLAASAGNDVKIFTTGRQWNLMTTLEGHDAPISCLRFGENAKKVYSSSMDGKILRYNLEMEDIGEEEQVEEEQAEE